MLLQNYNNNIYTIIQNKKNGLKIIILNPKMPPFPKTNPLKSFNK